MRPNQPHDLHGNVPDQCELALLLVDVISDFAFPTAEQLFPRAFKAAQQLARLKARARQASVPCIYVNDNYGRWRSDFRALVTHCLRDEARGKRIAELLAPGPEDYFVLKPKHSAFYQTCLSALLEHLGTKTVILAGFATDSCVMFSATDAYLRGYGLVIPRDGTAADDLKNHKRALSHMERSLHARIADCEQVRFTRGKRGPSLRVRST
ncbi:MAG TPA: isochorismatase family cysteine hydrolase [Polyangiales bacterium]|nr:isochorismatase family cysteine hydrolase [Polyangiales bacterium]